MRGFVKFVLGGGLFLVLAGGLLALSGWALGGQTNLEMDWWGHSFHVSPSGIQREKSGQLESRSGGALEAFHRIEIDVAFGDITVQEGEDYGVELSWRGERYSLKHSNENGKLTVWSDSPRGWDIGTGTMNYDAIIQITVPTGVKLELIDVVSNLGDVSLYGLVAEQMLISANLGNVNLGDITAGDAELVLRLGSLSSYGFVIDGTLAVENSLGDIQLEGDIGGTVDLTCSLGDMQLDIQQPADSFGYDLKVNMGEITIDGEGLSNHVIRKEGENFLTAVNSMGDIEVQFG